ncbi:MAG: hypothetical protein K6C05_02890 [Anaerovibrio sp.]|uniref:hypothetical protein n=1 Tax=Anaerovibrio sp. TaxID=1872532 RepID=UPI0025E4976F|nr:hypothetical protein [Anaerovibrio sp.]MCR5175777.1 hypothetical protein [Anaerovibrio sp.]
MRYLRSIKLLLVAVIMLMAASGTASAGSQDFTLVNGTGRTISYIYLSPTQCSDWIYQDELGNNVLRPGQEIFLDFDPRDNVQYWDVKVVYDNGEEGYWIGLDLYRIYSLTIRPGGSSSIEMI